MKIGVFLPNWIGDVVMATPTLRILATHFGPESRIVGIMRPYVRDVLRGTSLLTEEWLYDHRADAPRFRIASFIYRMHRFHFDLVLLLVNTRRQAIMSWLAGSREIVGYDRYRRGFFLTHRLEPPQKNGKLIPFSTMDYYLQLAYAAGCSRKAPPMTLGTTAEDEGGAESVWRKLGLRPGNRVVILNSSGAYGAAKLWPDEHFGALARRIASQLDHDVLVLCGPAERRRAARIVSLANHERVFSLAGEPLSIGLSKAVIRRSRLLVSTDSGPRHFAAAFGVPGIVLFGPTDIRWSETHVPHETHLQEDVDCGPCQEKTCPLDHHRCMVDLPVEKVYSAVCERLQL